jgi:hypothetical protein
MQSRIPMAEFITQPGQKPVRMPQLWGTIALPAGEGGLGWCPRRSVVALDHVRVIPVLA